MSPLLEFEKMGYPEIDALNRDSTIVFLSVSPMEEHGPHLPVGVDYFNASFFARDSANKLLESRPELNVLLYPTLPIGANAFRTVGSVWIKSKTLKRLVLEITGSLAHSGFYKIAWFSAHGGPFHLLALEEACFYACRRFSVRMVLPGSAATIKLLRGKYRAEIETRLGRKFSEEEKKLLSHDFHAGWWETSMMLLLFPQLVKPQYKNLPPVLARLKDLRTNAIPTLGKGEGYMGSPSYATTEFAQATVDLFGRITQSILTKLADGENTDSETSSVLTQIIFWKFWLKRVLFFSALTLALIWAAYILWPR